MLAFSLVLKKKAKKQGENCQNPQKAKNMTKKQPDFTRFVVKKAVNSENGQKISTELLKTLQPGWIYCHNRNF